MRQVVQLHPVAGVLPGRVPLQGGSLRAKHLQSAKSRLAGGGTWGRGIGYTWRGEPRCQPYTGARVRGNRAGRQRINGGVGWCLQCGKGNDCVRWGDTGACNPHPSTPAKLGMVGDSAYGDAVQVYCTVAVRTGVPAAASAVSPAASAPPPTVWRPPQPPRVWPPRAPPPPAPQPAWSKVDRASLPVKPVPKCLTRASKPLEVEPGAPRLHCGTPLTPHVPVSATRCAPVAYTNTCSCSAGPLGPLACTNCARPCIDTGML